MGFEPTAYCLEGSRSIQAELTGQLSILRLLFIFKSNVLKIINNYLIKHVKFG